MHPEALFCKVYDELEQKHTSDDWYELLSCSRLLRQLLLDQTPLTVVANRRIGLKFQYHITDASEFIQQLRSMNVVTYAAIEGLLPDTAHLIGSKPIMVNRDKFFRAICLIHLDRDFRVRDIIRYCANVAGGIHYESMPDEEGRMMRALDQLWEIQGQAACNAHIKIISTITLRALKPLRERIEQGA